MAQARVRVPMPTSIRAKQFAMFDAFKGLKEALAAKERIPTPRKTLSADRIEELNRTITNLTIGQLVTVVYYCGYKEDYCQLTGSVVKVDLFWNSLQIGSTIIDFSEIYEIITLP